MPELTPASPLLEDEEFLYLVEQIRAEGHNGGTAAEEIAALAAYLEKRGGAEACKG